MAVGDMHFERHFDIRLKFSGWLKADGEVTGLVGGRHKQTSYAE